MTEQSVRAFYLFICLFVLTWIRLGNKLTKVGKSGKKWIIKTYGHVND